MLRPTELNTFGMANIICRDLLRRATGGYLSIKGVELRGFMLILTMNAATATAYVVLSIQSEGFYSLIFTPK